jgi:hypothetical protein
MAGVCGGILSRCKQSDIKSQCDQTRTTVDNGLEILTGLSSRSWGVGKAGAAGVCPGLMSGPRSSVSIAMVVASEV